ncbi:hypothetical protein CQA38_03495 [Campylobacter sp. MIT 12-5580]|nr:hypothetical protein CQA38_03495 [Campylobacter sp. MIT 12-5580]
MSKVCNFFPFKMQNLEYILCVCFKPFFRILFFSTLYASFKGAVLLELCLNKAKIKHLSGRNCS